VGSVIAQQADYYLISFDVGNFRQPWVDEEEVILIIEAIKGGRGYFAAVSFALDKSVDIQEVVGKIALVPVPEPTVRGGKLCWDDIADDNVVGYSIYKEDKRLNERVLTQREHEEKGNVMVKPVIKGGYETVYCSRETQRTPSDMTPLFSSFDLSPNPFSKKTDIRYQIADNSQKISLKIYDVSGRLVRQDYRTMGLSDYISWDGTDDRGLRLPAGVYFVSFDTGDSKKIKKAILLR
jgi:hypothetical protein